MFSVDGSRVGKPGHVEVEVAVIELGVHVLVEERLQHADVDDVSGVRLDLAVDAEFDFVVVTVIVGIVAGTEGGPVPFGALIGIVQAVGGIEMHAANDGGARHA